MLKDKAVVVLSFSGKLSILATSRKELVGIILSKKNFNLISFIPLGQLTVIRRSGKSKFSFVFPSTLRTR